MKLNAYYFRAHMYTLVPRQVRCFLKQDERKFRNHR